MPTAKAEWYSLKRCFRLTTAGILQKLEAEKGDILENECV
jgi:hypothetical protein